MSAIFAWIAAGDRASLTAALAEDASLADARDERGVSAVMAALYVREAEMARLVAATKGRLDVFEAAALDDVEQLEAVLRESPAAAQDWSPDGFTALHFAAFLGGVAGARALLAAGADPVAVSRNPMIVQPLHSAAAAGRLEVARVLLEAGADPNAAQQHGFLPLDAANLNRDDRMRELLLAHGAETPR